MEGERGTATQERRGKKCIGGGKSGRGGGVGDSQGGRKQEKLKSKIMEIKKKYKLN